LLKRFSEFFRNMLEAGTRGGPVPLEATSLQLKFLMDRVTGKTPHMETLKAISSTAPVAIRLHGWHALWSLLELGKIAKKYLLCDASDFIHRLIICYVDRNPPAALMHACQSSPFDANMAMAALKAFKDEMPIWMRAYFDKTRYDANRPPGSKCTSPPAPTTSVLTSRMHSDWRPSSPIRVLWSLVQ
jgi:hypothetical protein